MDVVKKDVEKINGHIEIDSWENKGTRISIKIPLTLAIIQTLLIRMGKHMFAIPLTSVREIIQVSPADISTIEGFEVIKFRDETIPVLRMNDVFNLKDYDSSKNLKFLVLATTGVKTVGFLVEEMVGEQDVVIKLGGIRAKAEVCGSTILATEPSRWFWTPRSDEDVISTKTVRGDRIDTDNNRITPLPALWTAKRYPPGPDHAIVSQKGGVGKTSTAVNLGACISRCRKVL
jgi:hypothetical protein